MTPYWNHSSTSGHNSTQLRTQLNSHLRLNSDTTSPPTHPLASCVLNNDSLNTQHPNRHNCKKNSRTLNQWLNEKTLTKIFQFLNSRYGISRRKIFRPHLKKYRSITWKEIVWLEKMLIFHIIYPFIYITI